MTVKEIVKEYLAKNGYDGLYGDECGSGCQIDDLIPCGEYCNYSDCKPGYAVYDSKNFPDVRIVGLKK